MGFPVVLSHKRIVLSVEPEAMVLLSELKATEVTEFVCPSKVAMGLPVVLSHRRMVLSLELEAMVLPSGLKATEMTLSLSALYP
jgi:hypothetical protein